MPLVKIDVIKGTRTREEIQKLGATIQRVMIEHFGAPRRDRYQVTISGSIIYSTKN
jgi:phenylpyruvate tautomerase PptA (4-oxalocrotonate tautomerase family)